MDMWDEPTLYEWQTLRTITAMERLDEFLATKRTRQREAWEAYLLKVRQARHVPRTPDADQ